MGTIVVSATSGCEETLPPPPLVGGGSGGTGGSEEGGGGSDPLFAGIISESSGSDFETNPQLASNGSVVAVAWTAYNTLSAPSMVGYAISDDGGETFSDPQLIKSDEDFSYVDPDVVVDPAGNVHVAFMAYQRSGDASGAIYVASSDASGTLGAPVVVTDTAVVGHYTRPRMTLTNSNRVIVAYTQLVMNQTQTRLAIREQTGMMWTIQQFSMGGNHSFPTPCAAASTMMGRTYLVELTGGNVALHRSLDNGTTWQTIAANAMGDQNNLRGPASCAAAGLHVYVSYGIRGTNGLEQVKVAYSANGGDTIMHVGVASDPEIAAVFSTHQLAMEGPDIGHAVYYNGAGFGDVNGTLRRVLFTPGNLIQTPPVMPTDPPVGLPSELVHEPIALRFLEGDAATVGDSVGLEFVDNTLLVAYVDNTGGKSHIAFQAITP